MSPTDPAKRDMGHREIRDACPTLHEFRLILTTSKALHSLDGIVMRLKEARRGPVSGPELRISQQPNPS